MGIQTKGLIIVSVWLHAIAFAKPTSPSNKSSSTKKEETAHDATSKEEQTPQPWYVDTPRPLLTPEEKKKICRTYEGHYISYYKDVFRVRGCKRILLSDSESYELSRQQTKIDRVDRDSKVIEALPRETEPPKLSLTSLCKLYRNHYITNSVVYYHLDAACEKHEFPNWDTFDVHRKSHATSIGSLQVLDSDVVHFFKEGAPIPSMADKLSTLKKNSKIALLPLAQACKGLIGSYVSYRHKVYQIQARKKGGGCEKVEKAGDVLTRKQPGIRIQELTHSQAYSIPEAH